MPVMNNDRLKKMLLKHEGYRQFVYKDTVGKLTVGIGRNLEDKGISEDEANYLLNADISYFDDLLVKKIPFYSNLDDVRKAVLLDMAFNLGIKGLLGFDDTLPLIAKGKYQEASIEMLNSPWARQVKGRALELSKMMKTGEWP